MYSGRIPWIVCAYDTLGHLRSLKESQRQLLTRKISPFTEWFISFHRYSLNVSWSPTATFVLRQEAKQRHLLLLTLSNNSDGSDQKRRPEASWNCLEIPGQPVTSPSSLPFPSIPFLFHSNSFHFLTLTEYFCHINKVTWPLPWERVCGQLTTGEVETRCSRSWE